MELNIYQVDAFTDKLFGGNPAAVIPLNEWLSDEQLQSIAAENNLSETAYYVPKGEAYELRWFTPAIEVDLCGHATLATAYVLFEIKKVNKPVLNFHSKSGMLSVTKNTRGYTLDFPVDEIKSSSKKSAVAEVLGIDEVISCVEGRNVVLAEVASEKILQNLEPDFSKLAGLHRHGLIVTAKGDHVDYVCRCFFPNSGINEDPATGSAQTILVPYWSKKTGLTEFSARQISKRGASLFCKLNKDRVEISGQAVLYMQGILQPELS